MVYRDRDRDDSILRGEKIAREETCSRPRNKNLFKTTRPFQNIPRYFILIYLSYLRADLKRNLLYRTSRVRIHQFLPKIFSEEKRKRTVENKLIIFCSTLLLLKLE